VLADLPQSQIDKVANELEDDDSSDNDGSDGGQGAGAGGTQHFNLLHKNVNLITKALVDFSHGDRKERLAAVKDGIATAEAQLNNELKAWGCVVQWCAPPFTTVPLAALCSCRGILSIIRVSMLPRPSYVSSSPYALSPPPFHLCLLFHFPPSQGSAEETEVQQG
jgi:hypothetical protein